MDGVLDYAPGTTIVHRLNPLVKNSGLRSACAWRRF